MSDQRVSHVIQPHEWLQIKKGSGNEFKEWMLVAGGAAFGFIQNVFIVGRWIVERAAGNQAQLAVWDVLGTFLFALLVAAAITLHFVCRKMKSDFEKVVGDIDNRKPQPFGSLRSLDTLHVPILPTSTMVIESAPYSGHSVTSVRDT